uniref:Uncharacterized protein n=1 Tax=Labrus bergylta TaxID=56723 RepID=A0A3Q3MQC0_9LABR
TLLARCLQTACGVSCKITNENLTTPVGGIWKGGHTDVWSGMKTQMKLAVVTPKKTLSLPAQSMETTLSRQQERPLNFHSLETFWLFTVR